MTEQQPIPILWLGKDDILYCQPSNQAQLEKLDDADVELIAEKLGDALQELYWTALDIVLSEYLEDDAQT